MRLSPSDALGSHQQQKDSAHQRQRADGRRDKMIVRGCDMHAQEFDGFSRRRKAQTRVGKHHDAEGDEENCNNGFGIHNERN